MLRLFALYTGKSFWNLIKSTRNPIVLTIFLLIWIQTDVRLDPNQSENGKYNLITSWFNKVSKRFLCVYSKSKLTLTFLEFCSMLTSFYCDCAYNFPVAYESIAILRLIQNQTRNCSDNWIPLQHEPKIHFSGGHFV